MYVCMNVCMAVGQVKTGGPWLTSENEQNRLYSGGQPTGILAKSHIHSCPRIDRSPGVFRGVPMLPMRMMSLTTDIHINMS